MDTGNLLSGPTTINLLTKLPANTTAYYGVQQPIIISSDGILPVFCKETLQYFAWNLNTGSFAWGPTTPYPDAWALYNWESQFVVNGILYNWGFDGMIHAFNVTTGQPLWDFGTGNAGSVTPYGTWPFYQGLLIADGKIFAQTGDHGNGVQPLYQGEGIYAVDAMNGTHIWNLTGWFDQPAIADGKLLSQNLYDNQIYCFAKGPTATTVTAPMTAVTEGSEALLQGTVLDTSAGTTQYELTKRFPDGVAAVSETDMKAWMEYVYEYQSIAGHMVTGVPVSIDAVDPNNNFVHLGDATSDGTGQFGFNWETPLVPGMYTIITTFAGSTSYYPSHAETHMIVSSAPLATPPIEYPQPYDYTMHFVYAVIAIIIAIAIVGILLLRRK
jgi:outer membrane protein assembly factor BamB